MGGRAITHRCVIVMRVIPTSLAYWYMEPSTSILTADLRGGVGGDEMRSCIQSKRAGILNRALGFHMISMGWEKA